MAKARNPARGVRVQGLEIRQSLAADSFEDTAHARPHQDPIAWLARRARISTSMASAVAAANAWGRLS